MPPYIYATPIIYSTGMLERSGAGWLAKVMQFNPLYHYMTAKDQPDGQNGEIPADVPIPLPKNWLLQSGILPAPEVLPLRN